MNKSFNEILDTLKQEVENMNYNALKSGNYLKSNGNDNGFERLVADILTKMSQNKKPIPFTVKPQFAHHFPDIDIKIGNQLYGLEVKSRTDGSFSTNGNSVFESITNSNYVEIALFFGSRNAKKNNAIYHVKYKPYWASISGIAVTHSPRFKISMNSSDNVFSSNYEYKNMRQQTKEERTKWIREKLNSMKSNQWYTSDENNADNVMPKEFNATSQDDTRKLADAVVHYPFDFFHSKKICYDRTTTFLLNKYLVFSSHLRDELSAGGQTTFNDNNIVIKKLPRRFKKLNSIKPYILDILNTNDLKYREECINIWEKDAKKFNIKLNIKNINDFEIAFRTVLQKCSYDFKDKIDYLILDSNTSCYSN